MYTIGLDIGSSTVKASLLDVAKGACIATATWPEHEMAIITAQPGWAEQDPLTWWDNVCMAVRKLLRHSNLKRNSIKAIGIAYQMHGLVLVNTKPEPIRPSIIWCDSRAVETGDRLAKKAGKEKCLTSLLNLPGNFTLSKLLWVKENEPETYSRIYKFMLPGDYIAMKMTGEILTTVSGLSEGIMWDFSKNDKAGFLFDEAGIDVRFIPELTDPFGLQGRLSAIAAGELDLIAGIPVSYRAGDQPDNAFSLGLLHPGEIAANAGTSGVVYGISDATRYDPSSRVNTFAHVNHSATQNRLGVLLCVNGTGIANSWMRRISEAESYDEMNAKAADIKPGADNLLFLPFGNGAERMLENRSPGAGFFNLNFNIHTKSHLYRAVQEGIAFAFRYGTDILREIGIDIKVIRAGQANMFLSDVFAQCLADLSGAEIQLFDTDGSVGAARGAALGAGLYSSTDECFIGLKKTAAYNPISASQNLYHDHYAKWKEVLYQTVHNQSV